VAKASVHPADLLGFGRLAVDGAAHLTGLIEEIHHNIAGAAAPGITGPITDLVYDNILAVTGLVGGGMNAILAPLIPMLKKPGSTLERDAVLAALNGAMGDYLAATNNPLAIPMRLRRKGQPLTLEAPALAGAIPDVTGKLVLLVHGLCMNDRQWTRKGHNHGTALARDLGYTAVHLHYNSGLHISTNGRAFANLIEDLVTQWPAPLEEFAIVAHSLGGLVSRSAYHYGTAAGHRWPHKLGSLVFLGTPHHGAPLERVGAWADAALQLSPYTSPLARLGRVRSTAITDLRHGNLLDEDWEGRDRFDLAGDPPRPVPLPANVSCYTIAATIGKEGLPGDGIVPLSSALGQHDDPTRSLSFPEGRQYIAHAMNHWDLLNRPAVYHQIVHWLT
jgi:hypothetical protein